MKRREYLHGEGVPWSITPLDSAFLRTVNKRDSVPVFTFDVTEDLFV